MKSSDISSKAKLSIIYRAYPKISKKTAIYFDSKDVMMDFCINSLKTALKNIEYEFIFISDGCTIQQKQIIERRMKSGASRYKLVELNGKGNQASFSRQIREACDASYDIVLLLEDDYYIDKRDLLININVISNLLADYSTFYYHIDSEASVGGMIKKDCTKKFIDEIFLTELPSTTLTFFANRSVFIRDVALFDEFSKGAHDSSMWFRITDSCSWFLTRIRYPLFYKNIKLYISIIRRYLTFMRKHPKLNRRLVFAGSGESLHLDSEGIFNRFSQVYFLKNRYLNSKQD